MDREQSRRAGGIEALPADRDLPEEEKVTRKLAPERKRQQTRIGPAKGILSAAKRGGSEGDSKALSLTT